LSVRRRSSERAGRRAGIESHRAAAGEPPRTIGSSEEGYGRAEGNRRSSGARLCTRRWTRLRPSVPLAAGTRLGRDRTTGHVGAGGDPPRAPDSLPP
jgi:hypothetical protein